MLWLLSLFLLGLRVFLHLVWVRGLLLSFWGILYRIRLVCGLLCGR